MVSINTRAHVFQGIMASIVVQVNINRILFYALIEFVIRLPFICLMDLGMYPNYLTGLVNLISFVKIVTWLF